MDNIQMNNIPVEAKTKLFKILRQNIKDAKFPPNYKSDFADFAGFGPNCLAYALQLKTDYDKLQDLDPNMYYPYEVFFLSSKGVESETDLVEAFFLVCKLLNIKCSYSSIEEDLIDGEYKIAIMKSTYRKIFTDEYDYHFIRENDDKTWSQKFGIDGTTSLIEYPFTKCWGYKLLEIAKIKKLL